MKPGGGSGVPSLSPPADASLLFRPDFFCFLALALDTDAPPVDCRPRFFVAGLAPGTGFPPSLAQ